jgi:hypothetical protein
MKSLVGPGLAVFLALACGGSESDPLDRLGRTCAVSEDCEPVDNDAVCCTSNVKCGPNMDQCVKNCSEFTSGGVPRGEGMDCQDSMECRTGLFCCLVPGENCDFDADQACSCQPLP